MAIITIIQYSKLFMNFSETKTYFKNLMPLKDEENIIRNVSFYVVWIFILTSLKHHPLKHVILHLVPYLSHEIDDVSFSLYSNSSVIQYGIFEGFNTYSKIWRVNVFFASRD